ncbi:MAG TPA: GNAT family N-acetyltransferase [Thermoplasmata archaeon]|nr:GNAT family N-acetyltransferase [Thermoplasmata archaeon]
MPTDREAPSVRPAERADLPAVIEVYNHYVRSSPATFEVEPVRVEDRTGWWEEHSGDGRYRLLVAELPDAGIVGWATSSRFRPRAAYETTAETSVYCRPGFEGRGVGSALYTALFRALESQDIERFVAGVALPNPASVRLHRRFGFEPVGTFHRIGRKFGRYWDVEWFERPARDAIVRSGPE